MKPSQSFFTLINIVLLQHVNNAHAIAPAWAGPQATVLGTTGLYMTSSPQITQAVDGISHLKNLLKRQADNAATCGFYQNQPLACLAGYLCASNTYGGAGCCPSTALDSCVLPTTCVNSASMSAYCGESCLNNGYDLKCTVAAYPYCLEKIWNYPDSKVREWACATINTVITLDPNPDLISGSATFSVPIVRNTASASVGNGGLDSNAGGNQIDGNTFVDGGSILVTNSGSGNDSGTDNGSGNGGSASGGGSANGANVNGEGGDANGGSGNGGDGNGGDGGGGVGTGSVAAHTGASSLLGVTGLCLALVMLAMVVF